MVKAKHVQELECLAPAEEMIRQVLRSQLKAMCKHRDRALNWKDPEGVHDMRVLSRRLRSAITDFRLYLRRASLPRGQLRTIADALGSVRDEDVALIALEQLKSKAKGNAADWIEILAGERRKRRKAARNQLKSAIKTTTLEKFRKEFEATLRTTAFGESGKSRAKRKAKNLRSFGEIGREIILARVKEFSDASPHLYFPFQIKELHGLRILAKRLRYAVEMFALCWPQDARELAKEIALLQTSLGELHDCDVWIEDLGKRLKRTARADKSDAEIVQLREGANWLLRHFAKERSDHYRDATDRWQQWQSDGFLERLRSVVEREPATS